MGGGPQKHTCKAELFLKAGTGGGAAPSLECLPGENPGGGLSQVALNCEVFALPWLWQQAACISLVKVIQQPGEGIRGGLMPDPQPWVGGFAPRRWEKRAEFQMA